MAVFGLAQVGAVRPEFQSVSRISLDERVDRFVKIGEATVSDLERINTVDQISARAEEVLGAGDHELDVCCFKRPFDDA